MLRKDRTSPLIEKLEPQAALRFLEEGRHKSSGSALATIASQPFYNPYILVATRDRLELHRRYFEYLLRLVPCYLVNTGIEKTAAVVERLADMGSDM